MRLLSARPVAAVLATAVLVLLGGCGGTGTGDDDPADDGSADAATPDVPPLHPEVDDWDAAVVTIERQDGEPVRVDVRVAATNEQRQRGLMHVEEVPDGAGMLFVYEEERTGAFWMKNTLVPLDIAFMGLDGDVRAILTMEPCEADPCPTYDPEVRFASALEVPAGWMGANEVAVGDQVEVGPVVSADVSADGPPD